MNENIHKHLDLIMSVINRMAGNSFKLKGWSMTLVAALIALSITVDEKIATMAISLIPIFVFWGLDGYYLFQERLFRDVYKETSRTDNDAINYDMNPNSHIGGRNTWLRSTFSKTGVFI